MDSPPPSGVDLLSPSNSSVGDYFESSLVPPLLLPQGRWTLKSVVSRCNNAVLPEGPFSAVKLAYDKTLSDDWLVPFFLLPLENPDSSGLTLPIGFLKRQVVDALLEDNHKMDKIKCDRCWRIYGEKDETWAVSFEEWFTDTDTREELLLRRTEHVDRLVRGWKEAGKFPDLLSSAFNSAWFGMR
jgi:hypothetical protein